MNKTVLLLILLLLPLSSKAQITLQEDFSDGNYTDNPAWTGDFGSFAINGNYQLQTKNDEATTCYLSTPFAINKNATWIFFAKINNPTTQNNYLRFYFLSNRENPNNTIGYYVQIGGSKKDIQICEQTGGKYNSMLSVKNNCFSEDSLPAYGFIFNIKLQLIGNKLSLYYKNYTHPDFEFLGSCNIKPQYTEGGFLSVQVKHTKPNGYNYFFDNLYCEGEYEKPKIDNDTTDTPQPYTDSDITDLVINEVMYDPDENGQEYVELYNLGETTLMLDGMSITNKDTKGNLRKGNIFPENSFLPPHSYATLCRNADSLRITHQLTSSHIVYSTTWTRALPNGKGEVFLLDIDGNVVDSMQYNDNMHHIMLTQTKGVSLERINPLLSSYEPSTWHSAAKDADYATPSSKNSQYIDIDNETDEKTVWLETESFSPDNDGYEDLLQVHYNLPDIGFTANITVFTPSGLPIAKITTNDLLSKEGTLFWDGRTSNNSLVPIGVYVLFCDFTNATKGSSIRKKLPFAVVSR